MIETRQRIVKYGYIEKRVETAQKSSQTSP